MYPISSRLLPIMGASAATLKSTPKRRVISAADSVSLVPGNKNRLASIMKTIPATAAGNPIQARSNIAICLNGGAFGSPLARKSITITATTRLVDDPISVQVPPRIEAKLKGI